MSNRYITGQYSNRVNNQNNNQQRINNQQRNNNHQINNNQQRRRIRPNTHVRTPFEAIRDDPQIYSQLNSLYNQLSTARGRLSDRWFSSQEALELVTAYSSSANRSYNALSLADIYNSVAHRYDDIPELQPLQNIINQIADLLNLYIDLHVIMY